MSFICLNRGGSGGTENEVVLQISCFFTITKFLDPLAMYVEVTV